jgi:hypothetical protein
MSQSLISLTNRRVVDTCVVSYLLKNHPLAQQYRPLLEGKSLGLSFMSIAELFRWSIERSWGIKKMQLLETMLKNYVTRCSSFFELTFFVFCAVQSRSYDQVELCLCC